MAFPWLKYLFVPSSDLAGTDVKVGPDVTCFGPGHRVVASARILEKVTARASPLASRCWDGPPRRAWGCKLAQLAAATGCEVVATASPENFDMIEKLGASRIFGYYRSQNVGEDVVAVVVKTKCARAWRSATALPHPVQMSSRPSHPQQGGSLSPRVVSPGGTNQRGGASRDG